MIFITLVKSRKKLTKETLAQGEKLRNQMVKDGTKILAQYWTLGRYDAVTIMAEKDEKSAMNALLRWGDMTAMETLVALTREEAIKLIEQ